MNTEDRERYTRDRDRILAKNARSRAKNGERWRAASLARYKVDAIRQTRAIWRTMIARCYDPRHDAFKYYGGTGITVCSRWQESFDAFVMDMGLRPTDMSIDRIDNNGDYDPSNCKWATRSQQMKSRRLSIQQIPSCLCGVCVRCKNREAVARYRAKKAAGNG